MSFSTRLLATRQRAASVSAALMVGLLGSSGASAQCVDTTGFGASFYPLGQGGAIGSIISTINAANTSFLTGTTAFVSAPGGAKPDQQGGGAWGRVIGGSVENKNDVVATPTSPLFGAPVPGNVVCNIKTEVDFKGFQVGQDISILNSGGSGANWHVGVTAGYFEADAKDKTFGTFSGNFQVPFAGLYSAFTKGNLALDAQARWDFYQNSLSDAPNGLFAQNFTGTGLSLTGNAAYYIPLHNNWFLEPSVGFVWSSVQLDPLNVSGSYALAGPGLGAPGTVQINDIDSLLGRASLRAGTSFQSGQVTWQPFATASVFREFKGNVTTNVATRFEAIPGGIFTAADNGTAAISTSRVGTYGQFGLGTAAVLGGTGWLGYARVDYRTGESIEGWNVNAGLRYQFSPEPAKRSIKDGPALASWSEYNWTGPYLGGFAGRVVGDEDWFTAALGTTDKPEFGGYLFGGQAGYNVQFGRLVMGIEGDYGFANAKGGRSCTPLFPGDTSQFLFSCNAEMERLAVIAGRLGFTWQRALFYAKGGLAIGQTTVQTSVNTSNVPLFFTGVPFLLPPVNGETKWLTGWALGAGLEFALTDKWSAKAEYMHFDLGSDRFAIDPPNVADASASGDVVRVGINYHFNAVRAPTSLK